MGRKRKKGKKVLDFISKRDGSAKKILKVSKVYFTN